MEIVWLILGYRRSIPGGVFESSSNHPKYDWNQALPHLNFCCRIQFIDSEFSGDDVLIQNGFVVVIA